MTEICPKCLYKPTEEEQKKSPLSCPRCECLYSEREKINAEKRRENEKLNAWRITRWSAKNKTQKTSFPWTLSLIAIIIFTFFIFNILDIKENDYSIENSNIQNVSITSNKNTTSESSSNIQPKNEGEKFFPGRLKYDEKGILTITSKKEISILFIQKGSNKRFGPFHISKEKPEKIHLERGNYIAQIDDGEKNNITSISFIGKTGHLNL